MNPSPLNTFCTKAFTDKRYAFWTINILGWLGYGVVLSGTGLLWSKGDLFQLYQVPFSISSGFLVSVMMRFFFQRVWHYSSAKKFSLMLLITSIFTGVWVYGLMESYRNFCDQEMSLNIFEFIGWYKYNFFVLFSWVALYAGIKYYVMYHEEHRRSLAAESMATQAQLKMLRYQLNPHFLFNTLNAISTLVLEQATRPANTMLTELSKFLRYSLETDPMQKVTLSQEVEVLQLYLNIEKVRFEERLNVVVNIEGEAKNALVPSLLLQPIIENSIKYAISKSESGGSITIAAKVFAAALLIEISDDGPGMNATAGQSSNNTGVGLANLKNRLCELYGSDHRCSFSEAQPHGLIVNIQIPYETPTKEEHS